MISPGNDRDLDLIRRLLSACPRLGAEWLEARADDDDLPLAYLQASALARVVAANAGHGETAGFDELFAEVERILAFGTEPDRELIVVGFLEDLQGWAGEDRDAVRPWLGALARMEWDALLYFWAEIARKKASGELPPGVTPTT